MDLQYLSFHEWVLAAFDVSHLEICLALRGGGSLRLKHVSSPPSKLGFAQFWSNDWEN